MDIKSFIDKHSEARRLALELKRSIGLRWALGIDRSKTIKVRKIKPSGVSMHFSELHKHRVEIHLGDTLYKVMSLPEYERLLEEIDQ